ncbi:uncharacterized protein VTP21DRAFT_8803 [Calcarisporiella thermophila]|uniref:uncharacterized protein n=1 Tax=Calcarisporiella thermophila TaxID=911321 RepID=UPI0037420310
MLAFRALRYRSLRSIPRHFPATLQSPAPKSLLGLRPALGHRHQSSRPSSRGVSFPLPLILIASGLTALSYGLYQYYTSAIQRYPPTVRSLLRKAIYYQNYGQNPQRSVEYYRSALDEAMKDPQLHVGEDHVTGIMIQLGDLLEQLGRVPESIAVLSQALEAMIHTHEGGTPRELEEGAARIRAVSIAQRLAQLHLQLKQDSDAERLLTWSVEQLLKPLPRHEGSEERVIKEWELPKWMRPVDLGGALESLASFYAQRKNYEYVIPLYQRTLDLLPKSDCHAAVLMCNLSEAYASKGDLEEARKWASQGLSVVESSKKQKRHDKECDEACGVLLFNAGMVHEMSGNLEQARHFYQQSKEYGRAHRFPECVQEADAALRRLQTAKLVNKDHGLLRQ